MSKKPIAVFLAAMGLAGAPALSLAALDTVDVGPYTAATGYFPLWYRDGGDAQAALDPISLELCLSKARSANGELCTLLPEDGFDPTKPIVFPDNFPGESFWMLAETSIEPTNGIELEVYVAGIEAAFASDVVRAGDQISFARIRIRANVSVAGRYTVTHPYGVDVFDVTQADINNKGGRRAINMTRDVGIGGPGDYTGALGGDVGPFLRRAAGLITATNPETGEEETFIGDPNVDEPVVGGRDGVNFVRIDGPTGSAQTSLFSVSGKILQPRAPTPVTVERSTYRRTPAGTRIEVFASSSDDATLCFRESLDLVPGTPPSPCLFDMTPDGQGRFYAHHQNPAELPSSVIVTAVAPGTSPTALGSALTDVVKIPTARFSHDTGTLTIEAASSDEIAVPDLAAVGFGRLTKSGITQRLVVSDLAQPPAFITVKSAAGGAHTEPVVVVGVRADDGGGDGSGGDGGGGTPNQAPIAGNDLGISVGQGASVVIPVLGNDSDPDGNTPLSVVDLTQPPAGQGSASTDGTAVTYTAPQGFAGDVSFTYRAQDSLGAASNLATVTVTVTNAPPVAGHDTADAVAGGAAVSIAVLDNDDDPDGNTPLAVTNLTPLPAGQGSVTTNGTTVTYTPPATADAGFDAIFSYQARDALGALSNVATVTVRVAPSNTPEPVVEVLTVSSATVRATGNANNRRYSWSVSGSTDQPVGNTITVAVTGANGQLQQIGTATPNRNNGRWTVSATNSAIDPGATPTATVTSLGASQTVDVVAQ